VLGGVGTLLVAVLWMRLFPGLRRLDSFSGPVTENTEQGWRPSRFRSAAGSAPPG
jgi:hypothetical protein